MCVVPSSILPLVWLMSCCQYTTGTAAMEGALRYNQRYKRRDKKCYTTLRGQAALAQPEGARDGRGFDVWTVAAAQSQSLRPDPGRVGDPGGLRRRNPPQIRSRRTSPLQTAGGALGERL